MSKDFPEYPSDYIVVSKTGKHITVPETVSSGGDFIEYDVSGFSKGDPVYIKSDGELGLASCLDLDKIAVGFVVEGGIQCSGVVGGFSGLIPGKEYYLRHEEISSEYPTEEEQCLVSVGRAKSESQLICNINLYCVL